MSFFAGVYIFLTLILFSTDDKVAPSQGMSNSAIQLRVDEEVDKLYKSMSGKPVSCMPMQYRKI